MPKYFTEVDRWISHECRLVKAGETFETEFPGGIKLKPGDTLREIKAEKPKQSLSDGSAPRTR